MCEERNNEQEAQSGEQSNVLVVEAPQYAEDELGPFMSGTPAGVLTRQFDDVRESEGQRETWNRPYSRIGNGSKSKMSKMLPYILPSQNMQMP